MAAVKQMRKPVWVLMTVGMMAALSSPSWADLAGLPDVTVVDGAIVSLRYGGADYVVADGDLVLGETTRWWVDGEGNEILWDPNDPSTNPPSGGSVSGTSTPKPGDTGAKADNFLFQLPNNGATDISSIDGINFQQTVFPILSDTFFLFERGGNDAGSWQAIWADDSLGPVVPFDTAANGGPYANTGIGVNGQNAFGVVFTTDELAKGVRITASGHDTLSISVPVPEPSTFMLFAVGALGLVGFLRGRRRFAHDAGS